MTLCGYVLYRSLRARHRPSVAAYAFAPALIMSATVIVTGNHYVVDGLIGAALSIGAALALVGNVPYRLGDRITDFVRYGLRVANAGSHMIASSGWVRATVVSLGSLLAFLVVGQVVEPDFTDYWGYMVGQIVVSTPSAPPGTCTSDS